MKQTLLAFGLVALLALSSTPAHADSAIDFSAPGVTGNLGRIIGWSFTTNSALEVTHLGYYDFGDDGLVAGHEVAIFDMATQANLGQVTVDPLDTKVDGFYYAAPSAGPIFLQANRRYLIAAINRVDTDPYAGDVSGFTTIPQITYTGGWIDHYPGGPFFFPTTPETQVSPAWFGPNFRTIPEPGALALFGLGSLAIAYRRRRRKASRA